MKLAVFLLQGAVYSTDTLVLWEVLYYGKMIILFHDHLLAYFHSHVTDFHSVLLVFLALLSAQHMWTPFSHYKPTSTTNDLKLCFYYNSQIE